MNHLVDLSVEGPYAAPSSCFPINRMKEARSEYCKHKRLYLADTPEGDRVVALVHLGRIRMRRYSPIMRRPGRLIAFWMDVITGTLYNLKTGRCLSSDTLKISSVRRSPESVRNLINKTFKESE